MASASTSTVLSEKKNIHNLNNSGNSAYSKRENAPRYRDGLDATERERCAEKIQLIKGQDPYEIAAWSTNVSDLPSTTYMDIVNYLLFTTSAYTKDQLRSYKGLDAYNQFVCGWVRDTGVCIINKCIVTAKVLHSQRLNDKPLRPWVIAEKDGQILNGHCNCMAGLGESCTHVAALLFYIEAAVKLHTSKTVTEEKAYWKLPSQFKHVSYEKLKNIDFSSAASLKKTYDTNCANAHTVIKSTPKKTTEDLPTTDTPRFAKFLKNLSEAPSKPAILSLMPKYSDAYVPEVLQGELPTVLTELFENSSLSLNYKELLDKSYNIKIDVTEQQAKHVEVLTRQQANNRTWFRFRAGRITASRMKSVCHTNPNSPSQSLIQNICYPDVVKFSSVATKWGCDHERHAREMFTSLIQVEHDNVHVRDSGLVISPQYPHIGASPNAIVTCDCCGKSTLEIKCPYCVRDSALSDKETGYLKADQNGNLKLTNTHQYYYQVQTQLGVCGLERAFFVVWTEKDIHVEEVLFNENVWKDIVTKSEHFFRTSILPEIIGKFFSQKRCENDNALVSTSNQPNKQLHVSDNWCYCRDIEHGSMVGCDNDHCKIQWFHFKCVGVKSIPKGKWYCPDCRNLHQIKRACKKIKTK